MTCWSGGSIVANTVQWASDPGYYGGDWTHALSAWTSTYRDLSEDKILRMPALLEMLGRERHHSPFEKSFLHFLVVCDTASHIHLLKHRIGVSVNGESARYKELKEDRYYIPEDWPEDYQKWLDNHCKDSYKRYHVTLAELTPILGRKRAKESARFFLPYAIQLTLDVSFNFKSFMHLVDLRYEQEENYHAQQEIHDITATMLQMVRGTGAFTHSLTAFGY